MSWLFTSGGQSIGASASASVLPTNIEVDSLRTDWFDFLVVQGTLKSPLDRKETNQSILKEINPEQSLEGLMLRLKLQYSGHLMRRANSWEKTLLSGKIEGKRRKGWQRMRWLDSITNTMDRNLSKVWEIGEDEEPGGVAWGCKELDPT